MKKLCSIMALFGLLATSVVAQYVPRPATAGLVSANIDTSAELKAILTDETGSGAAVFANTPALITPDIGAATGTSVNLTSDMRGTAVATNSGSGFMIALDGSYISGTRLQSFNDSVLTLRNVAGTSGAVFVMPPRSPAQITSDQNNYNAGLGTTFVRLSTDASRSLTGLTFTATQADGQVCILVNVGAQNIVLVNESASSTSTNRFHNSTGADITLAADQEVNCWYDGTTARWRVTKRGF